MRIFAPVMLAAALIVSSTANANAFGLFGHHFGGHDACCDVEPACGCEIAAPTCGCEVAAPACGCEIVDPCCAPKRSLCDKVRGLFAKKHSNCCEPVCGCEVIVEPACGCEAPCGCDDVCAPRKHNLLKNLFGKFHRHNDCCEPACGCEVAAPSCGCGF
ncbi:keratin-like protein [Roseimaritima multifibrata]|uniref:keratin-like protein n=1 Tax=Roseimaritima multifibrata TaxID=1930274 RepID=UPI0011A4C2FF|nr:keratin-like protein [Roseimaritima multifibrata]